MDFSLDRGPSPFTLGIDIGGSHLKAGVLDAAGAELGERRRVETPEPASPAAVCDALDDLVRDLPPFDRISVGFPGVVRGGVVLTAPNLGTETWRHFPLAERLGGLFGKPVRLLNDAEVAGLGVIAGHGVECVITLGTGMGFALFQNGVVGPHLELSHHPARHGKTYDQYVGDVARRKVGRKQWNRRVRRAIGYIATLTDYDTLYLGGGNTKHLRFELPAKVRIVANEAGITGGVRLWDAAMDRLFEPA